ncbi:unnamed protein product [Adineta ricciae]|uniref:Sulfotransferase domain-containing protein n=1 Tax=Adineta ricciae TaxID=249248 RepID=A0A816ECU5_ADIRI|nr:unnamed protein product [Adineta ricciae]CAF1648141.1 unnamed protein product [Adineta ricciae]
MPSIKTNNFNKQKTKLQEYDEYPDEYACVFVNNLCLPAYVTEDTMKFCKQIVPRVGDICFVHYPKSGGTWLSYILSFLINAGVTPTEDFLSNQIIWPEARHFTNQELEQFNSPRIFKSCLPYAHAIAGGPSPRNPLKYIYIARNPKDVAVSYYLWEFDKPWTNYKGTWDQWFNRFINGHVQRGDWFDHILGWYEQSETCPNNLLFIWYEDLCLNFSATVEKIIHFLELKLTTDIKTLISETQKGTEFICMKKRNNLVSYLKSDFQYHNVVNNTFFREGKIGSWKKYFTTQQNEQFDEIFFKRTKNKNLSNIVFDSDTTKAEAID